MKPYRIGDPEREGAGSCIDPNTRSVTLRRKTKETDSGKVVGYQPVCAKGHASDMEIDSNWEVAIKIDHFEIFRVKNGIDANVAKDQDRYAR